MTEGDFSLQNSGGTGAGKNADPVGLVAPLGVCDGGGEAILDQRETRETVVAAVESGVRTRDRRVIEFLDKADVGRDCHRFKSAGAKSASPGAQGRQCGLDPHAQG